jgi:hypothetical protein
MTLPSFFYSSTTPGFIAGIGAAIVLPSVELVGMNSPRELRDVARGAEPHAKILIFITVL